MVSDKESLHRCHLGVALGVHRVPYSRGWGLYCSFSPYGLCLPASVSPPGPWGGGGWRWYPGCDRAGRARLLTVSGPRGCGEAGARAAPGTRCGGAALAAPAARTLGLAHTWRAAAGAVPGALRPQTGMAGTGLWSQLRKGEPRKPVSHRACSLRAGDPPAPSLFA